MHARAQAGAQATTVLQTRKRKTARCGSTFWGHRGDSMSLDVLQWSSARPEPLLPDSVAAILPPQSLVTVRASAPATEPRVATASRRKVVGVDCV